MALGDVLDFFTGGGDTTIDKVQTGASEESERKGTIRGTGQTQQLGQVVGGTDAIRRLSEQGEAGGLAGLNRILGQPSGQSLFNPGFQQAGATANTASNLLERAGGIPDRVNELTQPIIAEARRGLEDQLSQNTTRLSAGAGSRLNSFVNTAEAEGRADLESQLAAISAQSQLSGLQLQSQDLLGAGGLQSEAGDLFRQLGLGVSAAEEGVGGTVAELITALRGATEDRTVRTETQQTENLSNIISEITAAFGQKRTEGNISQVTESPGSFNEFASGLGTLLNLNPTG